MVPSVSHVDLVFDGPDVQHQRANGERLLRVARRTRFPTIIAMDSPPDPPSDPSLVPSLDPSLDRPHPQLAELERRIAWFIDHPEYEQCVVVEPESQSIVRFHIPLKSMRGYRSEKYGRIMEVELTPDEAVREEVMRKIGFEKSGQRKGTFNGERNCVFPRFTKQAMKPKQAAKDVLRVMEDVFQVGHAWLWTFHVDDPNQWPDPLPKPEKWPPG